MPRPRSFPLASQTHTRSAPARLLEAAVQMFARRGFEGTSLRELAKDAGIPFQLIAYHFGSKEELWIAAVDHSLAQRKVAIAAAAEDSAGLKVLDPRLWMTSWLRTAILFSVEDPYLRQLITQEAVANSRRYHEVLRPKLEQLHELMESAFRHMIRMGLITRFTAWESVLLFRSLTTANIVMPFEVELTMGRRVQSAEHVEGILALCMEMLTEGRGADVPHSAQPISRAQGPVARRRKQTSPRKRVR